MYKTIIATTLLVVASGVNASPFPFISPETAQDIGLKGDVHTAKTVSQCLKNPLEEFTESLTTYDSNGVLATRSTVSQNLNFYLHPQASMGDLNQTLFDGQLDKFSMSIDANGHNIETRGEVLSRDSRSRAKVVKVEQVGTDTKGNASKVQFVYGFKYDHGLIVIDSKIKMPSLPMISQKSVAEIDSNNRILKHTTQHPQTKELSVDFSADYNDTKPTERNTGSGGVIRYFYDGEQLTRIESLSGLGIISYVVNIEGVEKDTCGNPVKSTLTVTSPAKKKLDDLFSTQKQFEVLRGDEITKDSDNFRLPKCEVYEMLNTYTYHSEC